ncbi:MULTISPECIES: hypothetical protein [unclassified Kutzneria]|uniref:hypothetical protein n=1 Tax=unclassified Kutzneria TaxID=2621979 RepID=UPI0003EED0D4|nr:hypothetical protein [Kutzneria sp. 744]EWM17945.1 hypothetical protein KUTG_08249 [Kutzneria sp. 744]
MNDRKDGMVRLLVRTAVTRMQDEDPDGALDALTALYQGADHSPREAADVLADASADMLKSLCVQVGDGAPIKMQLGDTEGNEIPIDDIDPPLRASFRAVMALVNSDEQSADLQLGLVFDRHDPEEDTVALMHLLLWTTDLLTACREGGARAPDWLADTSAG